MSNLLRTLSDAHTEPNFNCPSCNSELHTNWVDNGFGPFAVQVSPYICDCGWSEKGCKECIEDKCSAWSTCQGRALITEQKPQ